MSQWILDEDAVAPFFRQAADRGGRHWIDAFDGTRLAACRQARDWSQVEPAERLVQARADGPASVLDAARQIRTLVVQVSCYESGRTRPRAKAVQALAAALGVDVLQVLAPGTPVTLVTPRATGADPGRRHCAQRVSRSLYAAVEQGKRAASVSETAALAAALHTSVDQVRRALPPSPA